MRSHHLDTASLRVFLRRAGEGRGGELPVVLLHGFPQTSWMWRHQIPELARDREVFAPDTRGYGDTDKPRIRVTRDLLARDVVELLDALGLERAHLVGHDWGGIIAFKAAVEYPERFASLSLIDTLTTVWIPWGIHGYWFKCEPEAERFFEQHHMAFIRSVFGGEAPPYAGPPESPWAPVEGAREARTEPSRSWTPEDVAHYAEKFSDPGSWFHAVEYYRHALPFHREREEASARHGLAWEFWSSPRVASMWRHEGGIFAHPDFKEFPVFAPEDRHKTYPGPALLLMSPFLLPQAFDGGRPPPDDYVPAGNPFAESFPRHLPDLRTRGLATGHFIPEEAPEETSLLLRAFLAGEL